MKFDMGSVWSPKTGKKHDIIVNRKLPNKPIDILVGGGMVLAGICYLTMKAFGNGVWAYYDEEIDTLMEADIIGQPNEKGDAITQDHKWKKVK